MNRRPNQAQPPHGPPDRPPRLRPDIELMIGPTDRQGAPTGTIHDPATGQFDQANWMQLALLQQLRHEHQSWSDLAAALKREAAIHLSQPQLQALVADAAQRGLTRSATKRPPRTLEAEYNLARRNIAGNGLARCLFLRIPLIHPDRLLDATVGYVRWLGARWIWPIYLLIMLWGLTSVIQQSQAYLHSVSYLFDWQGLLMLGLAMTGLKVIHEFAHAYTAKAQGVRVPTMGVALILLWPIPFCDVTDAWRLADRRKRMLISGAGVLAELVIAGFALAAWSLLDDRPLRSICVLLSSATVISTVLINLNPAMRYDGYYLLMDLLRVDNLQTRAFALVRWGIRRGVFGMPVEPPEALSTRHALLLIGYALGAGAYRLMLYGSIAMVLYHRLAKVAGIIMFGGAIYALLIQPLISELLQIVRAWRTWRPSIGGMTVIGTLLLLGLWVFAPLPDRSSLPAVAVAVADQRIYAPIAGRIEQIYVQRGQAVRPGQPLLRITNPAHDTEREIIRFATAQADIRIRRAQVSATHRTQLIGLTEQRARLGAEQATIAQLQAAGTVTAQVGGTVVAWDASLRTGASVMRGSYLGRIVEPGRMKLHCYIPEKVLGQVKLGDALRYVDAATGRSASATIHRISPMRLGQLEHATLSSRTGGPIAVTIDPDGRMIPLDAWYLAEATLAPSMHARPRIGQPGQAWYIVRNESRARRWLGQLTTWLLSESGF